MLVSVREKSSISSIEILELGWLVRWSWKWERVTVEIPAITVSKYFGVKSREPHNKDNDQNESKWNCDNCLDFNCSWSYGKDCETECPAEQVRPKEWCRESTWISSSINVTVVISIKFDNLSEEINFFRWFLHHLGSLTAQRSNFIEILSSPWLTSRIE